jgi:N-acetylmuramoyl-L-alanine amidase
MERTKVRVVAGVRPAFGRDVHGRGTVGLLFAATAVALCACTGGGGPASSTGVVSASANAASTSNSVPSSAAADSVTPRPSQHHIVAISAGHGGPNNVGAVHHDRLGNVDLVEKDLNLDIARRLDALLRNDGFETVLIRDCDCSVSPAGGAETPEQIRVESQARADIANGHGAEVLVVIHHNGSEEPLLAGTEVYYNPERAFGDKSRKLAYAIHDGLIASLRSLPYDVTDRGVKDDAPIGQRYGQPHTFLFGEAPGFRATQMPGALGEALFVSNDTEAALLQREDVKQGIAMGYRNGIEAYFAQ